MKTTSFLVRYPRAVEWFVCTAIVVGFAAFAFIAVSDVVSSAVESLTLSFSSVIAALSRDKVRALHHYHVARTTYKNSAAMHDAFMAEDRGSSAREQLHHMCRTLGDIAMRHDKLAEQLWDCVGDIDAAAGMRFTYFLWLSEKGDV